MSDTILKIPAKDLIPNPNNPRQTYDENQLQELIDSIVAVGQLSAIQVRPEKNGKREIIAGHRRWLAQKRIGGEEAIVDCVERDVSDEESLQIALIENAARESVHPMEEAIAFEKLSQLGLDQATLTNKTGKRAAYIASRLRLVALCEDARKLFLDNRMTLDAAFMLARVDEATQKHVLKNGAKLSDDNVISDWEIEKALKSVLRRLSLAPWKLDEEYAKKPACSSCPYRTQAQSALFDDGLDESEDSCTRPKCWSAKLAHHYKEEEKLFKKANPDSVLGSKPEYKDLFHFKSIKYDAPFVDLYDYIAIPQTNDVSVNMCIKPHESFTNEEGEISFPGRPKRLRWVEGYELVFGFKPTYGSEGIFLGRDEDGFARHLLSREVSNRIAKAFKKPKDPKAVNWQTGRTNEQEDAMKEERKKNRLLQKAGEQIAPSILGLGAQNYDPRVVLLVLKNTYPFSRSSDEKLPDMIARLKDATEFEVNAEINKVILLTLFSEKEWTRNQAALSAARLLGYDIDAALELALNPPKKERKAKDPKPEGEKKKGKSKKTEEAPAEKPADEEEE